MHRYRDQPGRHRPRLATIGRGRRTSERTAGTDHHVRQHGRRVTQYHGHVRHPCRRWRRTDQELPRTCTSTTGGATHAREAHQSPITVTDLTAADSYRCTVAADNRVGLSPSSAGSSLVTARPTAPGAPTITSVNPIGSRKVMVAFNAPADNGGARIRNYLVVCTSSNGGTRHDRAATRSPIRVVGLTSSKTYTCTVAANNGVRHGPASPPSLPVVVRMH